MDASRSGRERGAYKSQELKNGENVFKQPQTIIQSPPIIPPVRTGTVPGPPSGVPFGPLRGPLGGERASRTKKKFFFIVTFFSKSDIRKMGPNNPR